MLGHTRGWGQGLEPVPNWGKPLGRETVVPLASTILGGHDPRLTKHSEVPTDGRTADGVPGTQVDHPGRTLLQLLHQCPPHRITECTEDIHGSFVTH